MGASPVRRRWRFSAVCVFQAWLGLFVRCSLPCLGKAREKKATPRKRLDFFFFDFRQVLSCFCFDWTRGRKGRSLRFRLAALLVSNNGSVVADSNLSMDGITLGAIKSASQLCSCLMHIAPIILPTSVRTHDP